MTDPPVAATAIAQGSSSALQLGGILVPDVRLSLAPARHEMTLDRVCAIRTQTRLSGMASRRRGSPVFPWRRDGVDKVQDIHGIRNIEYMGLSVSVGGNSPPRGCIRKRPFLTSARYENGRRYHAFHAGQYIIVGLQFRLRAECADRSLKPNDEREQDRLDFV